MSTDIVNFGWPFLQFYRNFSTLIRSPDRIPGETGELQKSSLLVTAFEMDLHRSEILTLSCSIFILFF